jgi:hypothetical protein
MSSSIEHFMWGYQRYYRTHVKVAADHVLKLLDEGLNPDVFLVGIRQEDDAGRHPACVEPEEDYWIESEELSDINTQSRYRSANSSLSSLGPTVVRRSSPSALDPRRHSSDHRPSLIKAS